MNATRLSAAALVASAAVMFASHPARADETEAPLPRAARFANVAPAPVVAASACSLRAVLTIAGQPRPLDVQVDGRRCSTEPAPRDALGVNVSVEEDGHVVLQADAPEVSSDVVNPVVVSLARELRSRIERASPSAPPRTQSARAYDARFDAAPGMKAYSPTMMGFGVASMVVGGIMVVAGTFGAFSNVGTYNTGGLGTGIAWMIVGAGFTAGLGLPLFLVGKHKVPDVTVGLAPTGGSLRFSF